MYITEDRWRRHRNDRKMHENSDGVFVSYRSVSTIFVCLLYLIDRLTYERTSRFSWCVIVEKQREALSSSSLSVG